MSGGEWYMAVVVIAGMVCVTVIVCFGLWVSR